MATAALKTRTFAISHDAVFRRSALVLRSTRNQCCQFLSTSIYTTLALAQCVARPLSLSERVSRRRACTCVLTCVRASGGFHSSFNKFTFSTQHRVGTCLRSPPPRSAVHVRDDRVRRDNSERPTGLRRQRQSEHTKPKWPNVWIVIDCKRDERRNCANAAVNVCLCALSACAVRARVPPRHTAAPTPPQVPTHPKSLLPHPP